MVEIAQLTDSGQKVFEARYAAKDEQGRVTETFEQAVHRLARTTALAEKAEDRAAWEEKFTASIGGLLFVPSTPIWANIGKTDRPWQPGACFVLAVGDSLESMYQTLKDTAMVFKSGGGVGYNFSAIRPRGSMVRSTKGQASGVVELIRLYDASSGMVMQGGVRRGASMGILNIDHPEVIHFINSKRGGDITHFNLSVGVTGAFMEALERDEEWPLVFNGEVHETVQARELWDLITESAHSCGDPGIIYLDRLQRDNPVPEKEINATNPCVTADTRLATQFGLVPIGELCARGAGLWVTVDRRALGQDGKGTEVRPAVPAFVTAREADVYRVVTDDGYEIKATEWHEFYTARGKLPLRELKPGDRLLVQSGKGQFGSEGRAELGTLLGLITGDGHFTHRGRGHETVVLNFWGADRVLAPAAAATVNAMIAGQAHRPREYRVSPVAVPERNHVFIRSIVLARVLQHYGFTRESKVRVPEVVWRGTEACVKAYLRALFQTDGTVNVSGGKRSCSVRLASSHEGLLKDVQVLLANFGVFCRIRKRRDAGGRWLPDGRGGAREYACRADYELIVDGESRERFMDEIGFLLDYKSERYREWVKDKALRKTQPFVSRVAGIAHVGREPVFDTTQADHNTVIFNGLVTGQCGEQPLSPGESCLLGSVNLARMLKPGRDGYVVDWELLRDTVRLGIRFLDNLIDVAEYPLDFIADATRATRKVGLGYTGLHDLLIKMGLPYDAEEGRRFASTVFKAVQDTAHAYSRDLAGERGCFPDWERSVFHPHEKRRNAACITVAPTGSVTTIAGCEGYGIEPIFAVAYTKDTDVAGSFEVFSPLFLEACEKYDVTREAMSEVARRGGCQGVEGVPPGLALIFKGAQEISPRDHILMQAEVQKYVCNAVSKTINLPNTATIHDVETCYRLAYELGLKGITVFRDGCKQGVVTVGRKKREPVPGELARGEIMPRPENAQGVTHRLDSGCGKIYLTVNYHPATGQILETFITTGSDGGCLIYTEATSRLISLAIRGGIPLEEIIGQLQSTHACPSYQLARGRGRQLSPGKSCASAIARKLIEIQAELARRCNGGEVPAVRGARNPDTELEPDRCEICGLRMNRAEGCYVCPHCGFAKC